MRSHKKKYCEKTLRSRENFFGNYFSQRSPYEMGSISQDEKIFCQAKKRSFFSHFWKIYII